MIFCCKKNLIPERFISFKLRGNENFKDDWWHGFDQKTSSNACQNKIRHFEWRAARSSIRITAVTTVAITVLTRQGVAWGPPPYPDGFTFFESRSRRRSSQPEVMPKLMAAKNFLLLHRTQA